jgi:hypothetical protein
MNGDEFRSVVGFENGLRIGDPVVIRWTNCGSYYAAKATLSKINAKSFKATLDEEVPCSYGEPYSIGREIKAPRFTWGSCLKTWTTNNRVEPVGGYK